MTLLETVGPVLGVWALVAPSWAPLLLAERVRALFDWPTDSLPLNYLLVSFLVAVGQFVAFVAVTLAQGGHLEGMAVLRSAVAVAVGYPLVLYAVAAVALPAWGRWDPVGEGVDGRIALAVGAVRYAMVVGIAVSVVTFVAAIAAFPG